MFYLENAEVNGIINTNSALPGDNKKNSLSSVPEEKWISSAASSSIGQHQVESKHVDHTLSRLSSATTTNLQKQQALKQSQQTASTIPLKFNTVHAAKEVRSNNIATSPSHIPTSRNQHKEEKSSLLAEEDRVNGLHSVSKNCSDKHCTSLLSDHESIHYKVCQSRAFAMTRVNPDNIPYTCAFRKSRGQDPVGLVSIPGSGNTWVRGLLEKATGICTGSIYCDIPLRDNGFVGESVRDDSVIVVKSHTSDYQWRTQRVQVRNPEDALYGSAILLIRNPFDTLVAERHRTKILDRHLRDDMSHVGRIAESEFGKSLMCASR